MTSSEIPESDDWEEAQAAVDRGDKTPGAEGGGTPGAQGGDESDAADTLPGLPADHDAPLGSTDQHSGA